MPNPVAEAAVEALEIDAFAKDIQDLVPQFDTLYSFFKKEANTVPIANVSAAGGTTRPAFRVNMRIQGGAPITQGTGNGDSLGRGTGSQSVGMALSPVIFYSVCEITYLARRATQGPKRSEGGFNVQAQELKNSLAMAMNGLEALLQGDGSGTLDSIPSTAAVNNATGTAGSQSYSSIVGLNVAAQFTDQQIVQVFSAIGGTNRGSFAISYVDPVLNTIYSASALPSGTTTGDLLIVNGGAGSAGSSLMGLRAYQTNSTTGHAKSAWLGRASQAVLSTPNINLNGGSAHPEHRSQGSHLAWPSTRSRKRSDSESGVVHGAGSGNGDHEPVLQRADRKRSGSEGRQAAGHGQEVLHQRRSQDGSFTSVGTHCRVGLI